MASIREQILSRIVADLGTLMAVTVYRSRSLPIARKVSPAIVVTPLSEDVEPQLGWVDRLLTIQVEVLVRGSDSVADATVSQAHAQVMQDTRLGGLAVDIEETGSEWDLDSADSSYTGVTLSYRIRYRTRYNDLTLGA